MESIQKSRRTRPISDARRFSTEPINFLRGLIEETNHSPFIPFQLGFSKCVMVTDVALIRELLNDYETFEKKSISYNESRDMFDNGIVFSNGEEWRHNRKVLNPAFHKQAIESYLNIFSQRGSELAMVWRKHGSDPVNIYRNFVNTTVNTTIDIFFNYDLTEEDKKKVVSGIDDMLTYTMRRLRRGGLKFPDFIPVPENRAVARAKRGYVEVMRKIFDAKSVTAGEGRISIIELLLASESFYGGKMTQEQVIAEAKSLMLAGTETTASILTWLFLELAFHPEIKDRVTEEIKSVLQNNEEPTGENLKQLRFSRQTINEILRLYPPTWILNRSLSKDTSLGGQKFKKGLNFFFSPYLLHREPSVWGNPESFDPDRFSSERFTERQKQHFVPFISGPRKCIGEEFAILEALTIMSKTIPYFDWTYPLPNRPTIEFNATMRPRNEKDEYEVLMQMTPKPVSEPTSETRIL